MPQPAESKYYTYSDYCTWDDSSRWELIAGVPHMLAPGPSPQHQSISGRLFKVLSDFLEGKPCQVFSAPLDVRLSADTYDDTVVQPDLLVVCDESKLDDKGCTGAPDMTIEVLSPSSQQRDRYQKFQLYRDAGVREYWIVDPESKTIQVHVLRDGDYITYVYSRDNAAPVSILDGLTIDLKYIFD